MPKFYVTTKEVHEVIYLVEAEDKDEAVALVYEDSGSANVRVEEDSFYLFDKDETFVEEADE